MKARSLKFFFLVIITITINCQPPRLPNLGNTCYMNSVIQNMYAINSLTTLLITQKPDEVFPPVPALPQEILQEKDESLKKKKVADFNKTHPDLSLANGYTQLVKAIKTRNFATALRSYAQTVKAFMAKLTGLTEWDQQDATEYIDNLIDQLSSYNPISQLFEFSINNYLRTNQSDPQNFSKTDPFYSLSLPIINNNMATSLNNFFAEEYVSDAIPPTYKQFKILTTPQILVISLKRFSFDPIKKTPSKITADIAPLFNLNLRPYLDPTANTIQPTDYSLIGIAVHSGESTTSGHYVAYVKNNNKWYFCNDAPVTIKLVDDSKGGIIEEKNYPISQGYMFTYIRKDLEHNLQSLTEQLSILKEELEKRT